MFLGDGRGGGEVGDGRGMVMVEIDWRVNNIIIVCVLV